MAFDQTKAFTKLESIVEQNNPAEFIFDFLLAFGSPKATITKLKNNLGSSGSVTDNQVMLKNKIMFTAVESGHDLHAMLEDAKNDSHLSKNKIRFVIITDFEDFLAYDLKAKDLLNIEFVDVAKNYAFFLPLAGIEKFEIASEHPADVRASYKMGQLCDVLRRHNDIDTEEKRHAFNVFLTRLLFCFYAEDTGVFAENQMVSTLQNTTEKSGKDTALFFSQFFEVLNTPEHASARKDLPNHFNEFPYVNGGLFAKTLWVPEFTDKARRMIIEIGALEWDQINPDIFGSMFQAVIDPEQRGSLGQHYTSVPNIMKVIQPLFLDELREALEKARGSEKKLQALLMRLQRLRVMDVACGSGNFIIIAYKELRLLEMEVFKALDDLGNPSMYMTGIQLSQFYGIEIDDFAHEIAILSLWLTENQMNKVFENEFGYLEPMLPLKPSGNIVHGNALRLNWEDICPKSDERGELEVYICGNPPFLGGKSQSKEQKNDLANVFDTIKNSKQLDLVAGWFYKSSNYMDNRVKCAFVTTNSICQGAQVEQLWPAIFSNNVEISFAYKPFKWNNNAKNTAGVTVTIIGLIKKSNNLKKIYDENKYLQVKNINAYLMDASNIIIKQRSSPFSSAPPMITGNSPYDSGQLSFTNEEKKQFVTKAPSSEPFFRKVCGSEELINNKVRWCLWINNENLDSALNIPEIKNRIDAVKEFRVNGGDVARGIAHKPHQFRYTNVSKTSQVVVPIVSSERREYLPLGYLSSEYVILSSAATVHNANTYTLGILSSKLHYEWMSVFAGRLENRFRYLSGLVYNTFPWPEVNDEQKSHIQELAEEVLLTREDYPDMTLAQMYNPDTMPEPLLEAHQTLDKAVEKLYRDKPFEDASERLSFLFKRYEQLIAEEAANA